MPGTMQSQEFEVALHDIKVILARGEGQQQHRADNPLADEFSRDLERRYQEEAWMFIVFAPLGELIMQTIKRARQSLLRAVPGATPETLNGSRALLSLWVSLCNPVMQRSDFFGRHGKRTKELRALKDLLPDIEAQAKLTLAEWVEQAPSLSPGLRVRPLPPERVTDSQG